MADPSRCPDTDASIDSGVPTGMPRWVKVSAIILGVLVLVVVAVMVFGGGNHGPGRHVTGSGMPGGVEAPAVPRDEAPQQGALPAGGRG